MDFVSIYQSIYPCSPWGGSTCNVHDRGFVKGANGWKAVVFFSSSSSSSSSSFFFDGVGGYGGG